MSSDPVAVTPTPSSSADFPPCLRVSPSTIKIDVVLHNDILLDLQLDNILSCPVAFKVKTTARDRYLLRPTQDIIRPNESKIIKIQMAKLSEYPDATNPKNMKDKFLVQSFPMNDITFEEGKKMDLTLLWKMKENSHCKDGGPPMYSEEKVKCKLNIPAQKRAEQHEGKGEEEEERAKGKGQTSSSEQTQPSIALPSSSSSSSLSSSSTSSSLPFIPPINIQAANSTSSASSSSSGPTSAHKNASSSSSSSSSPPSSSPSPNSIPTSHPPPSSSSSSSSSSGDLMSDFDRLSTDRQRREYSDLMDFVVKLTSQMEREKVQSADIADRYSKALVTIAQLQRKTQQLIQFQQLYDKELKKKLQNGNGEGEGKGQEEEEEKGKEEKEREKKKSSWDISNPSSSSLTSTKSLPSSTSSGLSLPLTHVILIFLLAIVIGKFLPF